MHDAAASRPHDRQAAAVIEYARALDARDWPAYRALFAEQIAIDYGAIGSLVGDITADDWTRRCRTLEGFDATAHRILDPQVAIDGDKAVVRSIVEAVHFVAGPPGEICMGDLIGHYTHRLHRHDRWRIVAVTLDQVEFPAGRAAFDAVFATARAIHERTMR